MGGLFSSGAQQQTVRQSSINILREPAADVGNASLHSAWHNSTVTTAVPVHAPLLWVL